MKFAESDGFLTLDTASQAAVGDYLADRWSEVFPEAALQRQHLKVACERIEQLFLGQLPRFQAADTPYHNLEHTFQVAVCLMRLIQGAIAVGHLVVSREEVMDALLSAFCHDMGYLKHRGDDHGTGAKYTAYHEARGALVASEYLRGQGVAPDRIHTIQSYILSTGMHRGIRFIPFHSKTQSFLAQCLVTADIISQVSDPSYKDRLPLLFQELKESDDFLEIPSPQRRYPNIEALQASTKAFWDTALKGILEVDCKSVYKYLSRPLPSGPNAYLDAIV
jgi:hypothetical protein